MGPSHRLIGLRRPTRLCTLAIASVAAAGGCDGPKVSAIRVRHVGRAGLPPVPEHAVEIVRGAELRPHVVIAELEVPTDGSSYEELVERLRRRAGDLGADVLCNPRSVFDVGDSQMTQLPGPPRPSMEDQLREATALGVSLLLKRPRWVSVRGTAVLLDARSGENPSDAWIGFEDPTSSPARDVQASQPVEPPPSPPAESKPADKP